MLHLTFFRVCTGVRVCSLVCVPVCLRELAQVFSCGAKHSDVLLLFPNLFLRDCLSLDLEPTALVRLFGQQVPGIRLSLHPGMLVTDSFSHARLLHPFKGSELRSSRLLSQQAHSSLSHLPMPSFDIL